MEGVGSSWWRAFTPTLRSTHYCSISSAVNRPQLPGKVGPIGSLQRHCPTPGWFMRKVPFCLNYASWGLLGGLSRAVSVLQKTVAVWGHRRQPEALRVVPRSSTPMAGYTDVLSFLDCSLKMSGPVPEGLRGSPDYAKGLFNSRSVLCPSFSSLSSSLPPSLSLRLFPF